MVLEEYFDKHILNNSIFHDRISRFTNMFVGRKIPTKILKDSESYTDSRKIVLGINQQTLKSELLNKRFGNNPELLKSYFIGLGVHEAEHIISSDFETYKLFCDSVVKAYQSFYGISKKTAHEIAKRIGNSIEDGRIERRAANRYPGVAKHLSLINYILFEDSKCLDDEFCDLMNNILFMAKSGKMLPGTIKLYKGTELYDILRDVHKNIKVAVATDDVSVMFNECWKIHNRIFHYLGPRLAKEDEQIKELIELLKKFSEDIDESMSNPTNDEVGNDKSIKTFRGEEIDEALNETEDSNREASDSQEEDESLTEKEIEFFKDLIEAIKEDEKKESQNQAYAKSVNNKVNNSLPTIEEIKTYTERHQCVVTDISETSIRMLDGNYKKRALTLKKDLKEILVNKKAFREIRKRRGSLDSKRFTSLIGFHDDRVFYKKEKTEVDEYAFYVIIDNSGSMQGRKHFESLVCASILEEAIKDLAPIKFIAFDSNTMETNILTLKEFDKNRKQSLLYADFNTGSCNCDAFVLNYAKTELKKRRENKKIIFIISDGLPTINMSSGNIFDEVKQTAQSIRDEGIILIPIAISDNIFDEETKNRFCYIYDNLIIFSDIQKIEKHIVDMIKRILVL